MNKPASVVSLVLIPDCVAAFEPDTGRSCCRVPHEDFKQGKRKKKQNEKQAGVVESASRSSART